MDEIELLQAMMEEIDRQLLELRAQMVKNKELTAALEGRRTEIGTMLAKKQKELTG